MLRFLSLAWTFARPRKKRNQYRCKAGLHLNNGARREGSTHRARRELWFASSKRLMCLRHIRTQWENRGLLLTKERVERKESR